MALGSSVLLAACLGQAAWVSPADFGSNGTVPGSLLRTGRTGTARDTLLIAQADVQCGGPSCRFALMSTGSTISETVQSGPWGMWDVLPANASVTAVVADARLTALRMVMLPLTGPTSYTQNRTPLVLSAPAGFTNVLTHSVTSAGSYHFVFYGARVLNPAGGAPFRLRSLDPFGGDYVPFGRVLTLLDSSVIVLPGTEASIFSSWGIARSPTFPVELIGDTGGAPVAPTITERRLFAIPAGNFPLAANEGCPSGITVQGSGLGCGVMVSVSAGTTYALVGQAVVAVPGMTAPRARWRLALLSAMTVVAEHDEVINQGAHRAVSALAFVTPQSAMVNIGVRIGAFDAGTGSEVEAWSIGYSLFPLGVAGSPDGSVADAGVTEDAGVTVDAGRSGDAGVTLDAGSTDAGAVVDAGGIIDAGLNTDGGSNADAGALDASVADGGWPTDAGSTVDGGEDAGPVPDAGLVDDGGRPAGAPDAGSSRDGGLASPVAYDIGCSSPGTRGSSWLAWLMVGLVLSRNAKRPRAP
jgi:hypothetical protein